MLAHTYVSLFSYLRGLSRLYHLSFLSSRIHYACPLAMQSGPVPPLEDVIIIIGDRAQRRPFLLPCCSHHYARRYVNAYPLPTVAAILNVNHSHALRPTSGRLAQMAPSGAR